MKTIAVRLTCAVWAFSCLVLLPTSADERAVPVEDFDAKSLPETLTVSDAKVALKKVKGG